MHVLTGTTTEKTAAAATGLLIPGQLFYDTTLNSYFHWDGTAFVALGGAACLDGIQTYDGTGGSGPFGGGFAIPMDTTMLNTDGTNYGLGTVVAGAITVLNDGDYIVRGCLGFNEPGSAADLAATCQIITTPSGLGTWAPVVGGDGFSAASNAVIAAGGILSAHAEVFITISGGGGLDIMLNAATLISGGAEFAVANTSRLSVHKRC